MKRILILGSSGFLGTFLFKFLKEKKYEVFGQSRYPGPYEICNPQKIHELTNLFSKINPNVIINLIANTDVNLCQKNKKIAFESNVLPSLNIRDSLFSLNNKVRLIYVSTDHVYDGDGYKKEEQINPLNEYALTKIKAEKATLECRGIVIRTNFIGKNLNNKKKSLTDWLYHNLVNEIKINVFDNILVNPLNIKTLCFYISLLIDKENVGVFNLGASEGISKADLAFIFANELNLNTNLLKKVSFSPKSNQSIRPSDMRMDVSKFQNEFDIKLPSIKQQVIMSALEYEKIKI